MESTSTPTLTQFNPKLVPHQIDLIRDVRKKFDYADGKKHEILLSGSVGSAKSLPMAHLGLTHCLLYPGARFAWVRRRMPDLKATIIQKVREHIGADLKEGEDYEFNKTSSSFRFANGSEMLARSWNDKQFFRLRSLELSAAGVEELTENDDEYEPAYKELYSRIGRLPHIPESFLISATNPDSPSHWVYKRFIQEENPTRHVYYSVTKDNPFLPAEYVNQLLENYDERMAQRMVFGRWVEITQDVIYYAYDRKINYKKRKYSVNPRYPVHISWDFNIGLGKPLSACLFQYIDDHFHFFADVVIEGADTEESCKEMLDRGYLNKGLYYLHGDASGNHRDTRSKTSDWQIIKNFFKRNRIMHESRVPKSNPPVRKRHNIVNAYCRNAAGKSRLSVYSDAKIVDEGLRLTSLKKGGQYIEDDSKHFQHVTTAVGYGIVGTIGMLNRKPLESQKR